MEAVTEAARTQHAIRRETRPTCSRHPTRGGEEDSGQSVSRIPITPSELAHAFRPLQASDIFSSGPDVSSMQGSSIRALRPCVNTGR